MCFIFLYLTDVDIRFNNTADIRSYDLTRFDCYKGHIIDFFEFYRAFDFESYVLDTYIGKAVPKRMIGYRPVMVYGPILSQNLTKALKKEWIRDFKKFCVRCITEMIAMKKVQILRSQAHESLPTRSTRKAQLKIRYKRKSPQKVNKIRRRSAKDSDRSRIASLIRPHYLD